MFMRSALLYAVVTGMGLSGSVFETTAAGVVLNEVQAANQATIANGGRHPDWVELINTALEAKDLGGMSLSDDLGLPRKFVFPSGTQIGGGGRLVVWCDDATSAPGLHTGFMIEADGATLTLYSAAVPPVVVDSIAFGLQVADYSLGRVPEGTGTWRLCQPTPWTANVGQTLGAQSRLRINEWMAKPDSGDDWLELYNPETLPVLLGGLSLTDTPQTPALSPIPAHSYIGPSGFQLFWADGDPEKGADHANFKLSGGGETLKLNSGTVALDTVTFGEQEDGASEGRLPDGSATIARFRKTQSPAESNYLLLASLVVNEVLAHTDPPIEDAVEFYNQTLNAVDIGGWYLSNKRTEPFKYRVPDGVKVPAQGYCVFYEYQFNANPDDPKCFAFNSAHGDDVVLSQTVAGALTGYRVYEKFPATANGVSLGRYVKSDGADFPAQIQRSFGRDEPEDLAEFRLGTGAANPGPIVGPVVISEIMYHPPDVISGGVTNDITIDEFIELKNLSTQAVPLYDPANPGNAWAIEDGVEYAFPVGVTLEPGAVVLVVSFNPATDAAVLAQFKAKYFVPGGVSIYGPWKGKLDNGGETVDLVEPDAPQTAPHPDAGYVPMIRVDRVKYGDSLPWPVAADGGGQSLQRLALAAYGNDSANWIAAAPTAGWIRGQVSIESVRIEGSQVTLRFYAAAGASYSVEVASDVAGGAWDVLASYGAQGAPRWQEASDTVGAAGAKRYYRVVTPARN